MCKKILKFTIVFIIIFSWIFGYPPVYENFWRARIWQNPPIPPKIQEAQAAVTFVAAGSFAGNATTNSQAITAPACAANDILIAVVINKALTNTIQAPDATWTQIYQAAGDCTTAADDHRAAIFWKKATGSGGSFTFTKTTDDNVLFGGAITAWRGVNTDSPLDATAVASQVNAAAADNVTFPAFDPTGTNSHILFVAVYGNDATTFAAAMSSDVNPDCTTRLDVESSTGNDVSIAITAGDTTDGANIASRTWASVSTVDAGSSAVIFGLKPIVVPTVTTQAASSVEATTATGNGTIEATGGINATAWGVCYKTSTGCTTADSVAAGSGSGGAGAFTASMTSLSTGTTYYIRAYATNSAGTSYGGEVTILTKPAAPTSINFTSVTETTLRLNWTAPTGAASYKVERCTGTGCSSWSEIATGITNTYYDDTGRTGNTVYRYQVRATNATGDGAYSSGAEQLMLPGVPTSLNFTNVQVTTLTINWTAPTGGAASYKVERCVGSGCTPSEVYSGVADLFKNDLGLTANTLYRYRVRATNATGDGAYSGIGETTTQAVVYSVSVSDGNVTYGVLNLNTSRSTLPAEENEMQTATNGSNVTAKINIKGTVSSPAGWTLGGTAAPNVYVHEFCNDTDNDCSLPPTSYTALTTGYVALKASVTVDGTVDFQLRITTPTSVSDYTEQDVDVWVQAVQP